MLFPGTDGGFCEDNWLYIKINGNVFRHASMAPRCPVITVDPDKGCLTISSFDSLVSKALNPPVFQDTLWALKALWT